MASLFFKIKAILKGIYINDYANFNFHSSSWIGKGVSIFIPFKVGVPYGKIQLEKNTKVGSYSELSTVAGGEIIVKDYTTLNTNTKIIGDVVLERYCVISANVFISSGNHYAFNYPELIIRNQDEKILSTKEGFKNHSKKIHIEEDVWIGFGVFVAQGVTIGRGAVIGANSTILKDVKPYEVHVGSPSKCIKKRSEFLPLNKLDYKNKNHWIYFYRGFDHKNIENDTNNHLGIKLIDAGEIILEKNVNSVIVKGFSASSLNCNLTIQFKGEELSNQVNGEFEIRIEKNKEISGFSKLVLKSNIESQIYIKEIN